MDDDVALTPAAYHILLVLAAGDAHGYAIMQEVERMTHGQMRLGPGTLYRSVGKLVRDELIEEVGEVRPLDERRVVYRLTRRGRDAARAESRRLELLVRLARRHGLIGEKTTRPRRTATT